MQNLAGCSHSSSHGQVKTELLAYPLIFAIHLYRWTVAPLFGTSCRFVPSCSHYAEDALRKYGVLKGSYAATRRLLRCHPWNEGGYDPVE
jgi:putative membrane protein insertion efficiency factor